jgi:hypothetical protein
MQTLTRTRDSQRTTEQDVPAEGFKAWRDAAQAELSDPVIEACIFNRPSSETGNRVAAHLGWISQLLLSKHRQMRAGGLPEHFILAVTSDEVIALERKMRMFGPPIGTPGAEVARWKRSSLHVVSRHAGRLTQVTLTSADEGEKVECCVGTHVLSDRFIALLADPTRETRIIAG